MGSGKAQPKPSWGSGSGVTWVGGPATCQGAILGSTLLWSGSRCPISLTPKGKLPREFKRPWEAWCEYRWAWVPAAGWGVRFFREFACIWHALEHWNPSPWVWWSIPAPSASDMGTHGATLDGCWEARQLLGRSLGLGLPPPLGSWGEGGEESEIQGSPGARAQGGDEREELGAPRGAAWESG